MARTRRSRAVNVPAADTMTPLDLNSIVAAALSLLDQVGLAGLSMRRLAERLGIQAGSLYWYVHDKHELLSLLAEQICREVQPPDLQAAWRTQLETLMGDYRRVLLAHRDAAQVLAATPPAGSHRLRLVDLTLGAVMTAGFSEWDAARAGRILVDFTTGFVQEEYVTATRPPPTAAQAVARTTDTNRLPTLQQLSVQEYPHIASLRPYLFDPDGDARFEFGLSLILDGLEQRRDP